MGTPGNVQQQQMFPQPAEFAQEIVKAMAAMQQPMPPQQQPQPMPPPPQQQQQQPQQPVEQSNIDPSMAAMLVEWDRLNNIQGQIGEDARHGVGVRILDMARAGKRPIVRDYQRITEDTPILAEAYVAADIWSKGCSLFPEFVPTPMVAMKLFSGLFGQ